MSWSDNYIKQFGNTRKAQMVNTTPNNGMNGDVTGLGGYEPTQNQTGNAQYPTMEKTSSFPCQACNYEMGHMMKDGQNQDTNCPNCGHPNNFNQNGQTGSSSVDSTSPDNKQPLGDPALQGGSVDTTQTRKYMNDGSQYQAGSLKDILTNVFKFSRATANSDHQR